MIRPVRFPGTRHRIGIIQGRKRAVEGEHVVFLLHLLKGYVRTVRVHDIVPVFNTVLFLIVGKPVLEVLHNAVRRQCRIIRADAVNVGISTVRTDNDIAVLCKIVVRFIGEFTVLHAIDIKDGKVKARIAVSFGHDDKRQAYAAAVLHVHGLVVPVLQGGGIEHDIIREYFQPGKGATRKLAHLNDGKRVIRDIVHFEVNFKGFARAGGFNQERLISDIRITTGEDTQYPPVSSLLPAVVTPVHARPGDRDNRFVSLVNDVLCVALRVGTLFRADIQYRTGYGGEPQ